MTVNSTSMQSEPHLSVVMIAGEASGDQHGARVIRSLRKQHDNIAVAGAGGSAMQAAGAEIVVDIRRLSVLGFTVIFGKAYHLLNALRRLKRLISRSRPDLLILIDFPDFNLHLAGHAKKEGIPVLYYIGPQLWAWRSGRVLKIRQRVDHMAVILPFEEPFYAKSGVPVTFVGHPLMDGALHHATHLPSTTASDQIGIALLPGSREGEVKRLLPEMLKAVLLLRTDLPGIRIVISRAPTIEKELIEQITRKYRLDGVLVSDAPVYKLFQNSHLTIVTSGTASLEAAIFGIPAILVYAVSALSYALGRLMIKVPHIGLANLIAERRVIPELIQEQATAANIAARALDLLSEPEAYRKMLSDLSRVRQLMGPPGASDRVAEIAGRLMADYRVKKRSSTGQSKRG